MCLFCKKKKKNYTALKVLAIVFTALAAVAAAYVVFDKFFKEKVCKFIADLKASKETPADEAEEIVEEAAEAVEEAVEDAAEAVEEAVADAE